MSLSLKRAPDAFKKPLGTALRPSWKRLGPFRELFGASGGRRGSVLEPLEGGSGASWGRLGVILGCLGASFERLEPYFPATWSHIDACHLG